MNHLKRNLKDSLFRGIFKDKENFVELYYDITKKKLKAEEIERIDLDYYSVTTIVNDISYITKDGEFIIFIEHQSTLNSNIGLRLLMYFISSLQKYIDERYKSVIYRYKEIDQLPRCELYVVYNGTSKIERRSDIKKAYDFGMIKVEVEVTIIDINYEKLEERVKETRSALVGYSYLIYEYTGYIIEEERKVKRKSISKEEKKRQKKRAFKKAIEQCKSRGLLTEVISKKEFINMALRELTKEEEIEILKELIKEEGRTEGFEEGTIKLVLSMKENGLTSKQISLYTSIPEEDIARYLKARF